MNQNMIGTPTLLLDVEKAKRNIHNMANKASLLKVVFKPHFKTHQSAIIGEWFREAGVNSITVSSVDMAVYFQQHGWHDITIAFPANCRQIDMINKLAGQVKLGLLFESIDTISFFKEHLTAPIEAWIKIDTGANRTGIPWDQPEAIFPLASEIQMSPYIRLRGLLTHAGQTYHAKSKDEIISLFNDSVERIKLLKTILYSKGIPKLELSVGDTPGCCTSDDFNGVDEIRPGNFIFFDAQQLQLGSCSFQDIAVALACPVVATHAERNEVVIYGGAIHLSKDYLIEDQIQKYGYVAIQDEHGWQLLEGAYVKTLSQEHGILYIPGSQKYEVKINDLLYIIPAHSCLTVSAMKCYLTLQNENIPTMNLA